MVAVGIGTNGHDVDLGCPSGRPDRARVDAERARSGPAGVRRRRPATHGARPPRRARTRSPRRRLRRRRGTRAAAARRGCARSDRGARCSCRRTAHGRPDARAEAARAGCRPCPPSSRRRPRPRCPGGSSARRRSRRCSRPPCGRAGLPSPARTGPLTCLGVEIVGRPPAHGGELVQAEQRVALGALRPARRAPPAAAASRGRGEDRRLAAGRYRSSTVHSSSGRTAPCQLPEEEAARGVAFSGVLHVERDARRGRRRGDGT